MPVIRVPMQAAPPHDVHTRLAAAHRTTFLLESREGPERMARYSLLGFAPAGIVRSDAHGLHVRGALPAPSGDQDPLTYLRRIQAFYATAEHDDPFVGGLVGFAGHELVRDLEPALAGEAPETGPRFLFGVYLDAIVWDHQAGTVHYVSRGEDRSHLVDRALKDALPPADLHVGPFEEHTNDDAFGRQVHDAQEQIRAGEAFQIVLSRAWSAPVKGGLAPAYAALRDADPAPYHVHLRFADDDEEIIGASPEMLVRVRRGRLETFPIAGTRPMGADETETERLGRELEADPKERAEHAMLVDLARNDIGRVAAPGSVAVASYRERHRFRRVQHLVSHVTGRLADGKDGLDALAATFPAGTVSGAPKVRALQHIARIEQRPRGAYAGAVCYHSFNGDFDSAITIRSAFAHAGRVTVQAGAGITIQSDAQAEADETRHKAAAVRAALERFQGGHPGRPAKEPA